MQLAARKMMMGLSAGLLLLSACGGSSDDGAGQLSEFQLSPTSMSLASGTDFCPAGDDGNGNAIPIKAGELLIIGGTAPYTVVSAFPDALFFGGPLASAPTHQGEYKVSNRNGRVSVFVLGCLNPGVVTVLDNLKRVATIEVTAASGSGSN